MYQLTKQTPALWVHMACAFRTNTDRPTPLLDTVPGKKDLQSEQEFSFGWFKMNPIGLMLMHIGGGGYFNIC